jgi:hypothetical protein
MMVNQEDFSNRVNQLMPLNPDELFNNLINQKGAQVALKRVLKQHRYQTMIHFPNPYLKSSHHEHHLTLILKKKAITIRISYQSKFYQKIPQFILYIFCCFLEN